MINALRIGYGKKLKFAIIFHRGKPVFSDVFLLLMYKVRQSLKTNMPLRRAVCQLRFYGLYQQGDFCWFCQEIIHLLADGLQRRLEIGVARQNERDSLRMGSPHGADYGEAITRLTNVEVGD